MIQARAKEAYNVYSAHLRANDPHRDVPWERLTNDEQAAFLAMVEEEDAIIASYRDQISALRSQVLELEAKLAGAHKRRRRRAKGAAA